MFIKVALINNMQENLWYAIPGNWKHKTISIGSIVRAPLRNREVLGFVQEIYKEKPNVNFTIKPIISIESLFDDNMFLVYLQKIASYYLIKKLTLLQRIKHFLNQKSKDIMPISAPIPDKNNVVLTMQQKIIMKEINTFIMQGKFQPFLLHGVTGSGKTEVYKELIKQTLVLGKSIIFLVPEVTLAIQFAHIFNANFPTDVVCSFHSATSAAHKKILWQNLTLKKPCLIIGVHLPILLPIANLGLIIIDEEHEIGYQEKKFPRLNSKEAALLRAQLYNIPILLGSATPSVASYYNIMHKGWKLLTLQERFSGNFPMIKIINLKDHKQRKEFWLSNELKNAIRERLQKKEQTIIFLNRRGRNFFVQCKSCSFVFACLYCSVSLTLHDDNILKCHYCDFNQLVPDNCITCNNSDFLYKGIGTQLAVKILQNAFPSARIERADMDTTINRKKWQKIVDDMHNGDIDILVGTQTITKGYDFKKVTLVGVLWADLNVHFPIYNACEITLQQLIQVAGRAGRHTNESLVIVQTISDHTVFSHVDEKQYMQFLEKELQQRMITKYPPVIRLAEIELRNTHLIILEQEAMHLVGVLKNDQQLIVLGPASPPIEKIKNIYRKKIYLKAYKQSIIYSAMRNVNYSDYQSELFFQPNPLS